jgi:hypothetical protein
MTDAQTDGLWYYAGSEDAEHWFGALATRDEAIAAGKADHGQDPFWVCFGCKMKHALDVFDDDLDGVTCAFENANEDMFGEDGQGSPEEEWTDKQRKDLAARLNATFAAWAKEHGHDRAYMLDMRSAEQVPS